MLNNKNEILRQLEKERIDLVNLEKHLSERLTSPEVVEGSVHEFDLNKRLKEVKKQLDLNYQKRKELAD